MTPEAVSKDLRKIIDAAPVTLRALAAEAKIPYGRLKKLVSPASVESDQLTITSEDLARLGAALRRIAPKLLEAADRLDRLGSRA